MKKKTNKHNNKYNKIKDASGNKTKKNNVNIEYVMQKPNQTLTRVSNHS